MFVKRCQGTETSFLRLKGINSSKFGINSINSSNSQ